MFDRRILLAAVFLVGCDTAEQHGGGHQASDVQVMVGLAPRPAPAEAEAVHPEPAAAPTHEADVAAPPQLADAPDDQPPADEEAPPVEALPDDALPDDAPPDEALPDDALPDDAQADDPEDSPTAAPAGGEASTEAEWTKLARVRLGTPNVGPGLSRNTVKRSVREEVGEVRRCYAKGLVTAPDLAGKVEVAFVIDKRGKVESSELKSSTVGDATVEACIVKAVESCSFSTPADVAKVAVRFPFVLSL